MITKANIPTTTCNYLEQLAPLVPWTFPGSGDYLPRTLVHSLTFIPVSLFKGLCIF
jgi:hypothetical protein